eukprot:gene8122-9674_t
MPLIVLPNLEAVDFMAEAKEVIGLTTLLSSLEQTSEDDAVSQECDEAQTQSLSNLTLVLLFELLKIIEQRQDAQNDEESQDEHSAIDAATPTPLMEKELQKHYEEKNMSAERTQWVEMCFTSVALTLVAMLQKMQCLGLRNICSLLHCERIYDKEAISGNNGTDNGSNVRASGIAAMQRRIDSFNNNIEEAGDINKATSNITGMLNRGKSSKLPASNDNTVVNSRKERRTSLSKTETSASSQKLTRVSTSAGSGNTSAIDGSLTTTKIDNSSKGNRNGSSVLRKSASSIQQGSFRALVQTNRAARCVDDICKSGYLRTIVALLLHNKEIIRTLAAEVLRLVMEISITNKSNNKDNTDASVPTFVTDICACCVEQGMVPQLELTSAMLHSGNTKLRVNIFSGLMYLTGRCPVIGRRLCDPVLDPATLTSNAVNQNVPSAPVGSTKSTKVSTSNVSTKATAPSSSSSSKIKESAVQSTTAVSTPDTKDTNVILSHTTPRRTIFYDMLTTLSRDVVDFRNLLHVVIHFMEHTLTLQQEMQINVTGSNTSIAAAVMQLNPLLYKIEPMVLICDQTRVTRMICPPLNIIEQHSAKLATLVKVAMERQIAVAIQSLQSNPTDIASHHKEQQLMQALKNMDDSYFVTLQGSYNMWQEIFSHMSDSYLLQTSVPKISTIGLLECLHITTQYEMSTLGGKYSEALVQRLDNNNFIQIFRASVGLYFPPKVIVPSIISAKSGNTSEGATDIDPTPLALHLYQAVQYVFGSNLRKDVVICSNKAEPSLSDIVINMVPHELLPTAKFMSEESRNEILAALDKYKLGDSSVRSIFASLTSFSLPLQSFISDGHFTISYAKANYYYTFNDVHFVYRRNFLVEHLCGYSLIGDNFRSLCSCAGALPNIGSQFNDQFCVQSSICSDKSVAEGQCIFSMNPFTDGCVLISLHDDGVKLGHESELEQLVRHSVQYNIVVPTLYDTWVALIGPVSPASRRSSFAPVQSMLNSELFVQVESVTTKVLQNIPSYPVYFLLGYWIVTNARDLTDSSTMQVAMQGMYGLSLAFIVLAYVLYSASKRVMGRYGGPLAELAHLPLSFSLLSMTLVNPQILRVYFYAVLAFWRTGSPFGVWWLGKAYFLVCIFLCIGFCKYFHLFQPDTASWHFMHYSIKLCALLLLGHSSSCVTLNVLFVLCGCVEDHLRHTMWMMYLTASAAVTKPSYKYLAQKRMTLAETEELSKSTTAQALADLRQHLAENPSVANRLMDTLRESGKKDEAQLTSRFLEGDYPGVPYTVQKEDEEGGKRGWGLLALVVVVLVAVVGFGVYVVNSQEGVGRQDL